MRNQDLHFNMPAVKAYGGCGETGLQSYANISIKYSRNMKIVRVNSARRRCSKSRNYTREGERSVEGVRKGAAKADDVGKLIS